MRKIVTILAVLLLASPAMAAVTITVTPGPETCQATISYVDNGDPNYVRAFALDITVSDGNIDAVDPVMTGDCNATNQGYGIFPGSFARVIVVADPNWEDPGYSPVGYSDDLPGDTLGGIGTSGATVEMGSLYVDGNEPPSSGDLCIVTVEKACDMTVTVNAGRGAVVLEDASAVTPTLPSSPTAIPCGGGCLTCQGDWDEDGNRELVDDLMVFMAVLDQGGTFANIPEGDSRYNYCGDWDGDGNMELVDDLMVFMAVLDQSGTFANIPCP